MTVAECGPEFVLEQNSQDIAATLEYMGAPNDGEFGCLFVEVLDGAIGRVYGQSGFTPLLTNELRDVWTWYGIQPF